MKPIWRIAVCRRGDGSVLLEVMVALVLLSLLVVSLATAVQSVVGRADRVRAQAGQIQSNPLDPGIDGSWEWGEMVAGAEWAPGPALRITTGVRSGPGLLMGFWVDGWFVAEKSPNAEGEVFLRPPFWSGHTGAEVVVRVREAGSTWGPPWRSVVPGVNGKLVPGEEAQPMAVGETPVLDQGAGESSTGSNGLESVAHAPALANPHPELSWSSGPFSAGSPGVPMFLPPAGVGWCHLTTQGETQSWQMEGGRALDVYLP